MLKYSHGKSTVIETKQCIIGIWSIRTTLGGLIDCELFYFRPYGLQIHGLV